MGKIFVISLDLKYIGSIAAIVLLLHGPVEAQGRASTPIVSGTPGLCATRHDIGKLTLPLYNNGRVGHLSNWHLGLGSGDYVYDCITGDRLSRFSEYPKASALVYLMSLSLWLGGVVASDTLVTTASSRARRSEFNPDVAPLGDFEHRSILDKTSPAAIDAVSEQDFLTVFSDTFPVPYRDYFFSRPHIPLNVQVVQRSYAWSLSYAEDFILFHLTITNIGEKTINDMFVGLEAEYYLSVIGGGYGTSDDVHGYMEDSPIDDLCGLKPKLEMMWAADNNGDPYRGEFIDYIVWEDKRAHKSVLSAIGIMFMGRPENMLYSFNWWTDHRIDFGPRHREDFFDFRTGGIGEPKGDRNKYHVLSNGEIDYDQLYAPYISPSDPLWLQPSAEDILSLGQGALTIQLISSGPYDVPPGASMDIFYAVVAGEDFHTQHTQIDTVERLNYDPEEWYAKVDFSDLTKNARWAQRIYDNPGIDTDGDGYFGKSRVCVFDSALTESGWVRTQAETTWYEGDGVPDWRASIPPPAPDFWILPATNGLTIRFNGSRSETEKDIMTGVVDFEGYHIWLGRDDRESSYSVVGGYDLEDFDKLVWNERAQPRPNFDLFDNPFTIEQLRCLYGSGSDPCNDSTFDPYRFTRSDPYIHPLHPDSIFLFVPHNFNASQLGRTSGIRKIYPDELPPPRGMHPDSLGADPYTEDGYLKYYEYEFTIENLLPTVPYWVNVTAFDFGSPESGVFALESSKTVGAKSAFPFMADNRLNGRSMEVFVYPNPYRINADYRGNGYEGRTQEIMPNEKVRAIHFANLPPKCTISIFSIDGDLVREIHHDMDPADPNHLHDEWNLVSRNRQAVVSGLYYWTVEDDSGNVQIGKLAIIM